MSLFVKAFCHVCFDVCISYKSKSIDVVKVIVYIKIYVNEFATDSDLTVIHTHIASLNLIPGIPDISIVDTVDVCNMRISFVTQNEMNKITEKNEDYEIIMKLIVII